MGAAIHLCPKCGHLQKCPTPEQNKIIQAIYDNYRAHHISNGQEQMVFPEGLPPRTRTYHAIEKCLPFLPDAGKMLDFGCGNGAALKSAHQLMPLWTLFGYDVSGTKKHLILNMPQVADFYEGRPEELTEKNFDLIVAWHVLEHTDNAVSLLKTLRRLVASEGYLLVAVPDVYRTPFDLAVIDHCSHFIGSTLLRAITSGGWQVVLDGGGWIHNNLILLLKANSVRERYDDVHVDTNRTKGIFKWLNHTVDLFDNFGGDRPYALFGTGMASTWLLGQLSNPPLYFVDEDENRIGKSYESTPIVSPRELSPGIDILMPFDRDTGAAISARLKNSCATCAQSNFILSPFLSL